MNEETHQKLMTIKRSFRLLMNGPGSQSMRDKGLGYKLNWGVPFYELKKMAQEYGKDYDLAIELWKEDIRECKILATLIMPADKMLAEITDIWMEQVHEGSQKSIEEYQESSKRLDKYKRCFDIIDLILNGTATAFHGVRTYQSCSSNIKSYLQLLNEYEEKILLKGKVWSSDTIIYTTSKQTIEDIKSSASSIMDSVLHSAVPVR
jgi:hypothetical protein